MSTSGGRIVWRFWMMSCSSAWLGAIQMSKRINSHFHICTHTSTRVKWMRTCTAARFTSTRHASSKRRSNRDLNGPLNLKQKKRFALLMRLVFARCIYLHLPKASPSCWPSSCKIPLFAAPGWTSADMPATSPFLRVHRPARCPSPFLPLYLHLRISFVLCLPGLFTLLTLHSCR